MSPYFLLLSICVNVNMNFISLHEKLCKLKLYIFENLPNYTLGSDPPLFSRKCNEKQTDKKNVAFRMQY